MGVCVCVCVCVCVSVSRECFVLSGRGFYVGLITRPEESYTDCGVSECDREASTVMRPWPTGGCRALMVKGKSNSPPCAQ